MRYVFPDGLDASGEMTDAQRAALDTLATRHTLSDPVTVEPVFATDALLVNIGSMWLGVEADGYTHS